MFVVLFDTTPGVLLNQSFDQTPGLLPVADIRRHSEEKNKHTHTHTNPHNNYNTVGSNWGEKATLEIRSLQ